MTFICVSRLCPTTPFLMKRGFVYQSTYTVYHTLSRAKKIKSLKHDVQQERSRVACLIKSKIVYNNALKNL